MMQYNPANWYWSVGGSTTQVYSSARGAYVSVSDNTFAAWVADGNRATVIDTENNLRDVLAEQYPAGWPTLNLAAQARALLEKSDITILRCVENAIAVPSAWATYRHALRIIVSNPTDDASLPTTPDYPEGT